MHRIVNVSKIGQDPSTGARLKKIQATSGSFLSRKSAYNQSFDKIERIVNNMTGKSLGGPPIKFLSFKYSRNYYPRQRFLCIKELTESRLSKTLYHGVDVYKEEIKHIHGRLNDENRVAILNPQLADEDWKVFDKEDQISIGLVQAKAGAPHVSIPLSPKHAADESIKISEEIIKELEPPQNFILVVNPHTKRDEQKKLIQYVNTHEKCQGTIIVCRSPGETHNKLSYQEWGESISDNRLLIGAEVKDTFGGWSVPTQIVLRTLNFDLTCKNVVLMTTHKSYLEMEKKTPENTQIYVDAVAGFLNENEQKKYSKKSMTDVVLDHFSVKSGINFYDFLRAYNFQALNDTGQIEAEHILRKEHSNYIKNRLYLEAFIDSHKPLVPTKTS